MATSSRKHGETASPSSLPLCMSFRSFSLGHECESTAPIRGQATSELREPIAPLAEQHLDEPFGVVGGPAVAAAYAADHALGVVVAVDVVPGGVVAAGAGFPEDLAGVVAVFAAQALAVGALGDLRGAGRRRTHRGWGHRVLLVVSSLRMRGSAVIVWLLVPGRVRSPAGRVASRAWVAGGWRPRPWQSGHLEIFAAPGGAAKISK